MKERKQFERGVVLFNARKFFQAHEAWEELWLLESEPEKTFLQGLIQVAAAFHHYSRDNGSGAKSLLAAGTLKLGLYPGNQHGLALEEFRAEVNGWVRMLGAGIDPGLRQIPKIHLVRSASRRMQRKAKRAGRNSPHVRR